MMVAGLLYLGLFGLAASMNRHAELLPAQWRQPHHAGWIRAAAWLLVVLSLVAALCSQDWPMRLLIWIGLAPVAGGIVLLGLTYGGRWARLAALLAVLLVPTGIVSGL